MHVVRSLEAISGCKSGPIHVNSPNSVSIHAIAAIHAIQPRSDDRAKPRLIRKGPSVRNPNENTKVRLPRDTPLEC